MSKRLKLNLTLPDEEFAALRELAAARDEPLVGVVREALRLRRFVAEAERDGRRVLVEKDGALQDIRMM